MHEVLECYPESNIGLHAPFDTLGVAVPLGLQEHMHAGRQDRC